MITLIHTLHGITAAAMFGAAIIMSLCIIIPGVARAIRVVRNGGAR